MIFVILILALVFYCFYIEFRPEKTKGKESSQIQPKNETVAVPPDFQKVILTYLTAAEGTDREALTHACNELLIDYADVCNMASSPLYNNTPALQNRVAQMWATEEAIRNAVFQKDAAYVGDNYPHGMMTDLILKIQEETFSKNAPA